MTKNVNIVKDSKLKLFNDFHLIKNRITATQENNSVLVCVDCSEKKGQVVSVLTLALLMQMIMRTRVSMWTNENRI
ncbi:hypothetical protein DA076_05035 [Lactiplantibacillus plantarum]|nr:hypothetical protein DA076_05035 [Lactiplantibacillus plantarum]